MNEQLWAPWRLNYIVKEKPSGCIFCEKLKENKDKQNYILERSRSCFSILNVYPYNNGHLMVVPNNHISDVEILGTDELTEIMQLITRSVKALKQVMHPEGFNIGANIGRIAGAGIADHIHFHIVPRWTADTNFMPMLAGTNVIPQALDEAYGLIKKALSEIHEPALKR
jgi:ATP adenylyltransferase